jgi:hypothetical protein
MAGAVSGFRFPNVQIDRLPAERTFCRISRQFYYGISVALKFTGNLEIVHDLTHGINPCSSRFIGLQLPSLKPSDAVKASQRY